MQGPAGQYHALLAQTWAPGALDVSAVGVSASAQKDDATGRVVVRLVNSQASSLVVRLQMGGGFVHHLAVKVTTLAGTSLTQTNTPAAPLAIAPVHSIIHFPASAGNITLPPFSAVALEFVDQSFQPNR